MLFRSQSKNRKGQQINSRRPSWRATFAGASMARNRLRSTSLVAWKNGESKTTSFQKNWGDPTQSNRMYNTQVPTLNSLYGTSLSHHLIISSSPCLCRWRERWRGSDTGRSVEKSSGPTCALYQLRPNLLSRPPCLASTQMQDNHFQVIAYGYGWWFVG